MYHHRPLLMLPSLVPIVPFGGVNVPRVNVWQPKGSSRPDGVSGLGWSVSRRGTSGAWRKCGACGSCKRFIGSVRWRALFVLASVLLPSLFVRATDAAPADIFSMSLEEL